MVYRNDSITKFNERFINYGFNKISYVETLRRYEYRFILAGKVFAFDLPHLPYKSNRLSDNDQIKLSEETCKEYTIRKLYDKLLLYTEFISENKE